MKPALAPVAAQAMPVRKAIRRARWFMASFREHVAAMAQEKGLTYTLDEGRLTAAFMAWYRAFEAQKPKAADHRRAYVTFAAGLMLRELLHAAPLAITGGTVDGNEAEAFWPEGYIYVTYCLAVREAVLEQDFDVVAADSSVTADIRTWWSFRENATEDRNAAVSFFVLFAGETPDWKTPGVFNPQEPALAAPNAKRLGA